MGGRALFKAYFHITMASLIPLALMARMESLEMDSRILERVILAKVAIERGPQTAGQRFPGPLLFSFIPAP